LLANWLHDLDALFNGRPKLCIVEDNVDNIAACSGVTGRSTNPKRFFHFCGALAVPPEVDGDAAESVFVIGGSSSA